MQEAIADALEADNAGQDSDTETLASPPPVDDEFMVVKASVRTNLQGFSLFRIQVPLYLTARPR